MEIGLTGVHYQISDATKEHIYAKSAHFAKMKHLLDRLHVTIKPIHEHGHEVYEVHLHGKLAWHNAPTVEVRRSGDNLWAVIDESFESVSVSLHKHKERHQHIEHDRLTILDEI